MWPFNRSRKISVDAADPIDRLVNEWRVAGVKLNRSASERQLAQLEVLLGVPLPSDVARFYGLANGMIDYETDHHRVSFWSIERIMQERNETGPSEIGFADFLINSWYFVYRPISARSVQIGWHSEPSESLPSLTAFLQAYAEGSRRFCVL
jgi:hypothetical protein